MKTKFRYSEQHIKFLRTGYLSRNVRDLSKAFNARFGTNKTEGQIKSALKNYRILCGRAPKDRLVKRRRKFSPDQERFLRKNYTDRSFAELTAIFIERYGNEKTEQQIKTYIHNHGINSGRSGRFEKGHKPWNTGTKGQGLTGENSGSFKKGNAPANRKQLGSERICSKDGFILIKVAERNPYTGCPTRYKCKHVHVWEQAHGPVPEGMVVLFKDGDRLNCDVDNLILISRSELLRLNKNGYNKAPDRLKPSILALSKLEAKTFSVIKEQRSYQEV